MVEPKVGMLVRIKVGDLRGRSTASGLWCPPNMVLDGTIAKITEAKLDFPGGFKLSVCGYDFTYTFEICELLPPETKTAKAINLVHKLYKGQHNAS